MCEPETIHVVFNISDRYAMPVSVAIRSAVEHLSKPHQMHAFILEQGAGVSSHSKQIVETSLAGLDVSLTWLAAHLPENTFTLGSHPGGAAETYLKLLVGECLPESVTKVIFLDADVVVCKNLLDLWNTSLNGMLLGAVADSRWQCKRMARLPILDANVFTDGAYFNAGVMVIDLAAWRAEDVYNQAVQCASRFRDYLYIVDQDLLNCVVKGDYFRLDPSWNLLELYGTAYQRYWNMVAPAVYSSDILGRASQSPAIVHYSSFPKPWDGPYAAHDSRLFLEYYSRTAWKELSHALPCDDGSSRKSRIYRETVAILKVFYRELELGRFRAAILGHLVIHLMRNPIGLRFIPGIICRHGYWAVRAFAVPRLMARRERNSGEPLSREAA